MKECADRKQVKTEIGHEFPQQDSGPRIKRVLGNALHRIFVWDLNQIFGHVFNTFWNKLHEKQQMRPWKFADRLGCVHVAAGKVFPPVSPVSWKISLLFLPNPANQIILRSMSVPFNRAIETQYNANKQLTDSQSGQSNQT